MVKNLQSQIVELMFSFNIKYGFRVYHLNNVSSSENCFKIFVSRTKTKVNKIKKALLIAMPF